MAVLPYWKSRLEARCPLAGPNYWIERITYRPNRLDPADRWPYAVARYALYGDYVSWYKRYCESIRALSEPVPESKFIRTLRPWLYTIGRKAQATAYLLPQQLHHEDEWIEGRVHKAFVRLDSWEQHCAAFELDTGMELTAVRRDPAAAQLIDDILRSKGYASCTGTQTASTSCSA